MEGWFAVHVKERNRKAEIKSERSLESKKKSEHLFVWMGKQQMINAFGEAKAASKIASNKLESRPDPDSGLDDEWNREYKVWTDSGGNIEAD
eukprot:2902245-Pyramimonas_sp.AAC.1